MTEITDETEIADEVLPCPFCGTSLDDPDFPPSTLEGGDIQIECGKCQACWPKLTREIAEDLTTGEAVAAFWNRRAALSPAPQALAGEAPADAPTFMAIVDLIGELGREVCNLMDGTEESGPVGASTFTVDPPSFARVSAVLDRIDALPFEEPGYILGTGAMLQAALKQTAPSHAREQAERIARLEAALTDLLSWFPDAPSKPEWRIPAGEHGADDAIAEARARLADGGRDHG